MLKALAVFGILTFCSAQIASEFSNAIIVWNVGQGQWVTSFDGKVCAHFDFGGERFRVQSVQKLCGRARNQLWLSHWDWDHMSFLGFIARWPSVCAWSWPNGKPSEAKKRLARQIPNCDSTPVGRWLFRPSNSFAKSNSLSRISTVSDWLFSGDAPSKEELLWVENPRLQNIRVFVAGHHGSRTSNSEALIDHLPNLKMAVVSARFRRYGHPHLETLLRFRRHGVSAIRTEDWGTIWFTQ